MKNHVVLCPNPYKDKDFNYTIKAKNILEKAGHEVLVSPVLEYENGFDCPENIRLQKGLDTHHRSEPRNYGLYG